jgi:hypothetical protein
LTSKPTESYSKKRKTNLMTTKTSLMSWLRRKMCVKHKKNVLPVSRLTSSRESVT